MSISDNQQGISYIYQKQEERPNRKLGYLYKIAAMFMAVSFLFGVSAGRAIEYASYVADPWCMTPKEYAKQSFGMKLPL